MATFYSTGYGGNYPERMTLRTVATINSQSIANNSSNVTISAYAYYNYTSYNVVNPTEGGQSLRIDDVRVHSASENFDYSNTSSTNQIHLYTWTGTIYHNTDGTKTVNLKVWQDCPGVTTLDYLYGSHSWTLTAIPRVSTPTLSASSVALGSAVTIYTNRADTSLLHTLDYTIGSQNFTITTGVGDSYSWTLPLTIADVLPSATSGTVTITCYTWAGSTHVGTKTITLTATVPNTSTFKPTCSITSVAEAATEMIGAGFYLNGKSKLRIKSSGSAKYSASISSYKVVIDTATLTGSDVTSAVIFKTGTVSISLTVTDSRGYTGTASASVTFIALAAPTVSASSIDLGSSLSITTNRQTTAITHTLKYSIGTQSLLTAATGVGASTPWTVPLTIANALPSATSGIVTITQYSYNGSYLLGTKTVTFTAKVPSNATFQPTATISSITEGAAGLTAFTVFIQSKSKFRVQSTATPKYSATISQYKVVIAGSATHYGADITSAVQASSGSKSIVLTVTDSRGYTATHSLSRDVIAYSPPLITSFSAARSPTDQDSALSAAINFTISPISNQNTKRYLLRYRPTGGAYTNIIDSYDYYTRSITHTAPSGSLDPNLGYEVQLTVYDYFTSVTQTVPISTAFDLMNFNASGRGLAIGKVSEMDAFEVAMNTLVTGSISSTAGLSCVVTGFDGTTPLTSYPAGLSMQYGGGTGIPSSYGVLVTIHGSIHRNFQLWQTKDSNNFYIRHWNSTAAAWADWDQISTGASNPGLAAYPVGAIYMSVSSTSPATLFGGTWSVFGTGRTLVGLDTAQTEFSTIEKTGGHKNLQAHTHTGSSGSAGGHGHTASSGAAGAHTHTASSGTTGAHTHTGTAASTGAHTHNINYQRFTGLSTSTSDTAFDLNRRAGTSAYGESAAAESAGSHSHTVSTLSAGDHSHTVTTASAGDHSHTVSVVAAASHTHTVTVGSTGAGSAENLQPYITVYMWKRTA